MVAQLLTFVRVVRETATFVSNVRQDGIRWQGGHISIPLNPPDSRGTLSGILSPPY